MPLAIYHVTFPAEAAETWKECLTEFGLSGKQLWKAPPGFAEVFKWEKSMSQVQKFWSISGERVPPASRRTS